MKKTQQKLYDQMQHGRRYIEYLIPEFKNSIIIRKVPNGDVAVGLVLPNGTGKGYEQHSHYQPDSFPSSFYHLSDKETGENMLFNYFNDFSSELSEVTSEITAVDEPGAQFDLPGNRSGQAYAEDCFYILKKMIEADNKSEFVKMHFFFEDGNAETTRAALNQLLKSYPDNSIRRKAEEQMKERTGSELIVFANTVTASAAFGGATPPVDFIRILASIPAMKTPKPRQVPHDKDSNPIVELACEKAMKNHQSENKDRRKK